MVAKPPSANHLGDDQRKNACRIIRKLLNGSLPINTTLDSLPDIGPLGDAITLLLDNYKEAGASVIPGTIKAISDDYPILLTLVEEGKQEEEFEAHFLDFGQLRSLPKPEWLVYNMLPTKGINFMYGKPGCGKTFVAISIACSVAMNPPTNSNPLERADAALHPERYNWAGRVTKHEGKHVIYIAAEDIDEVAQRTIGWADHHEVKDIPNLHFFDCPLNLAKDTPRFLQALQGRYEDVSVALFVVDTLAMCSLGAEENSKKEFDAVILSLESLWRTYNCCILVVHHAGKNGEMRGTSSMDGVAYSMIQVAEEDENIVLKSIKKRRGKGFEDIYLDKISVPTGNLDEQGQPETTCVVTRSNRQADSDVKRITDYQQNILNVIKTLGSKQVPKTEVMKWLEIDTSKERTFRNAIKALVRLGMLEEKTIKRSAYYTLQEVEDVKSDI